MVRLLILPSFLLTPATGVITQTRRHTYLVSLLGIKHVVLAVNKMDLVDFSKEVFDKIVADYKAFIDPLGVPDVNCIPLSALDGDNVVEKSDRYSVVQRSVTAGIPRNRTHRQRPQPD